MRKAEEHQQSDNRGHERGFERQNFVIVAFHMCFLWGLPRFLCLGWHERGDKAYSLNSGSDF
jgi:hypothetical protein